MGIAFGQFRVAYGLRVEICFGCLMILVGVVVGCLTTSRVHGWLFGDCLFGFVLVVGICGGVLFGQIQPSTCTQQFI